MTVFDFCNSAVWRFILTFSVNVWWVLRTFCRPTYSTVNAFKNCYDSTKRISVILLYKSFVRPHGVCIQAWSPYLKRDIECLEKVQGRAIPNWSLDLKNLSYEKRLRKLHLTTQADRGLRRHSIDAYKLITGKDKIRKKDFFRVKRHWLQSSRTLVIIYKLATTRYSAVWRFVVTFSVNVWWVLRTFCRPTYTKHLQSVLSRIVTTRQRVEHHKADAFTPDIYKYGE